MKVQSIQQIITNHFQILYTIENEIAQIRNNLPIYYKSKSNIPWEKEGKEIVNN